MILTRESPLDWDKLRIFHAAAEAGSFTHAGEALGLSQSAVSRQVSALEQDLRVPLFHRHARGLILTEQGEVLFRTVKDVWQKLDATRMRLSDNRERPHGLLRVTTTVGIGSEWLTPRIAEFLELYPDIELNLILSDEELDIGMREADVALRVREPVQPDLIRRRLFTMHFHAYASPGYLKRYGQPKSLDDLDKHRILIYGASQAHYLTNINSLQFAGRASRSPRPSTLTCNNIPALRRAVEAGADMPELDCYLVYPEELKAVARIQVFRDFLVASAQRWDF
jgi:DNA-binding transcriptional LysR family regulator